MTDAPSAAAGGPAGEPTESFLDERSGAQRVFGLAVAGGDAVRRKMRRAERDADGESGACSDFAPDLNSSTVEADQFVDQGEPDAGAFVGASSRTLDAVEALKDAR